MIEFCYPAELLQSPSRQDLKLQANQPDKTAQNKNVKVRLGYFEKQIGKNEACSKHLDLLISQLAGYTMQCVPIRDLGAWQSIIPLKKQCEDPQPLQNTSNRYHTGSHLQINPWWYQRIAFPRSLILGEVCSASPCVLAGACKRGQDVVWQDPIVQRLIEMRELRPWQIIIGFPLVRSGLNLDCGSCRFAQTNLRLEAWG